MSAIAKLAVGIVLAGMLVCALYAAVMLYAWQSQCGAGQAC